jgi:hypothetical protein
MNVDEFLGQTGNWSGPASVDEKHNRLAGCTPTADDQGDDWRALQPIWNLFLAHSRYAAAPWFPIVIANFFFSSALYLTQFSISTGSITGHGFAG